MRSAWIVLGLGGAALLALGSCLFVGNDYDAYHAAGGGSATGGSATGGSAGEGGQGGVVGGGGAGGSAGHTGGGGAGGTGPCLSETDLVAHFDAGTLALADGAAVVSWPSTGSAVLNQTGVAPTFSVSGINGRPAVAFDGVTVDQGLAANLPWYFGAGAQNSPPLTVVLVARALDDQKDQTAVSYGQPSGQGGLLQLGICGCGNPRAWHFRMWNAIVPAGGAETLVQAAPGTQDTAPVVVTAIMDPTTSALFKNGAELRSTASTAVEFESANNYFRIGSPLVGTPWDGLIAEVLVYSSALTPGERQSVESCLGTKYGIAVQ